MRARACAWGCVATWVWAGAHSRHFCCETHLGAHTRRIWSARSTQIGAHTRCLLALSITHLPLLVPLLPLPQLLLRLLQLLRLPILPGKHHRAENLIHEKGPPTKHLIQETNVGQRRAGQRKRGSLATGTTRSADASGDMRTMLRVMLAWIPDLISHPQQRSSSPCPHNLRSSLGSARYCV